MLRRTAPLLAAIVLVACGGSDADTAGDTVPVDAAPVGTVGAPTAPGTTAPDGGGVTAAVPAALQFTAPLVGGGGEIELDAYAGRPVLLWFWAPW